MIRRMFALSLLGLLVASVATLSFGAAPGADFPLSLASLTAGGEDDEHDDRD